MAWTDLVRSIRPAPSKKQAIEERKVKDLVTKMLNAKHVEKLISPRSDEYFLLDKQNQLSLCIEHAGVKIANHSYLVRIQTTLKFAESLKDLISANLEEDRQSLKKELFKNQIDLIDNITNYYK